jgi:hypothetical protein
MISSGLKDEQKDIFQIWKEVFSQKEMNHTLNIKKNKIVNSIQNYLPNSVSTLSVRTVSTAHGPAMEAIGYDYYCFVALILFLFLRMRYFGCPV